MHGGAGHACPATTHRARCTLHTYTCARGRPPCSWNRKLTAHPDIHPDPLYQRHSNVEEWCHRGSGPAGAFGAEKSDCDSPLSLVDATFDWIAANVRDEIDFVIWTGDSARHDNDDRVPRTAKQVVAANRMMADKFAGLFADPQSGLLALPVVPNIGNNDIVPHNSLDPGPNKWLRLYGDVWRRFIPQEQHHAFHAGGWFSVEVIPDRLAVFSINTLYFFNRNGGADNCAGRSQPGSKQMEWLGLQLATVRQRGMKAMLIGHVPPARTGSKELWDDTCWDKYAFWLRQYRDVVVTSLYGHMNIDHFLLQDADQADGGWFGSQRDRMDGEITAESTRDYLLDLRDEWAQLPKPDGLDASAGAQKKGKKHKKKKHRKGTEQHGLRPEWGEKYSLSLISPSVIPNYFPALRVIEYNISGLEDAPVWVDEPLAGPAAADAHAYRDAATAPARAGRIAVPRPPSKSSPPGPAYSMQPLSLTGYTQYYANLTHIHNEGGAQPRPFAYEVEYSTFADHMYNMTDLTVNSFLELAYRMGQKSSALCQATEKAQAEDPEHNELWLHFLDHAFVKTVDREDLEELDEED